MDLNEILKVQVIKFWVVFHEMSNDLNKIIIIILFSHLDFLKWRHYRSNFKTPSNNQPHLNKREIKLKAKSIGSIM